MSLHFSTWLSRKRGHEIDELGNLEVGDLVSAKLMEYFAGRLAA